MSVVLALIGAALVLVGAALCWRWQRLAAQLRSLSAQTGASDEQARAALAQTPVTLLTIEVLNPLELAREHSRIGASLAGVAPGLVRKRVYQTVARELREELADRGVEANIEIQQPERQ